MYWSPTLPDRPASARARHIGIVLDQFSTGGSERVAIRLANGWAEAGRAITIFCGSAEGPVRDLVAPGVVVSPVPGGADLSRARLGRAIAAAVARDRPGIVFGPGNHHIPILSAMLRALPARRPAVVCKISNPLHRPDRSRIGQALFGAALRRRTAGFDRLVAMSPLLAAEAAAVLRRADIACAAEPTLDGAALPPRRRGPSGLVVAIGRLTAQKDFERALEAFALLPCHRRLAILGEGEDYDRLRGRARALGIADRVRFVGYVDDVRPWLAAADALLCTSRYEGYPAVMVEALAAGLPVVTTPCSPALPEILLDRSFGIVAGPQPIDLAEALEAVLADRRQPDPRLLDGLARRHALAASADAWLAIFNEVAERRAERGPRPVPAWCAPLAEEAADALPERSAALAA